MVSKRILNEELEGRIFDLFIKTLVDLRYEDEVKDFLGDLISPVEKIMLVKRLAIAILLDKGYTYEAIDNILKVSRPTINRVSLALKYGKSGYQKAISKIIKQEKREEFFDKIEEILIQLSPPKAYGSAAHQKKQKAGRALYERRKKRSLL